MKIKQAYVLSHYLTEVRKKYVKLIKSGKLKKKLLKKLNREKELIKPIKILKKLTDLVLIL